MQNKGEELIPKKIDFFNHTMAITELFINSKNLQIDSTKLVLNKLTYWRHKMKKAFLKIWLYSYFYINENKMYSFDDEKTFQFL